MSEQPGDGQVGLMEGVIRPRVDGQGCFICDIRCLKCSYNLRGMDARMQACPECGAGVEKSLEQYRRWWFEEAWLRDYLVGTACRAGVVVLLPTAIVVLILGLLIPALYAVTEVLAAVIFTVVIAAGCGYAWLISRPVRYWGVSGPRDWKAEAPLGLAGALVCSGGLAYVLLVFEMIGREHPGPVGGLICFSLFLGVSLMQSTLAWRMIRQHGQLSVRVYSEWYVGAVMPLPVLMVGVIIVGANLTRELSLAMLALSTAPGWIFIGLSNKVGRLVDEGVHVRLAGRRDGSVPEGAIEGVTVGRVFWPWWQGRMAARHEKRVTRGLRQGN